MGFLLQLKLLLWKNFILRKRQPGKIIEILRQYAGLILCTSLSFLVLKFLLQNILGCFPVLFVVKLNKIRVVVEIVFPLTLFLIVMAVKSRHDESRHLRDMQKSCHYAPVAMPSVGILSFFSSRLCDKGSTCRHKSDGTDRMTSVNNVNNSILSRIIHDVLSNNSHLTLISKLGEDLQQLKQFASVLSNGSAVLSHMILRLTNVLLSQKELRDNIAYQSISLTPKALDTLLNATLNVNKVTQALRDSSLIGLNSLINIITDFQKLGSNTTANRNLFSQLMNITCSYQVVFEYFEFSNPENGKDLQSQLCHLSAANVTALFQAIFQDLNRTELMNEIQHGFNIPDLNNILETLLSHLSSFGNVATNLASVASIVNNLLEFNDVPVSGWSFQSVLDHLICGNERNIFKSDLQDKQLIEKQVDQQNYHKRIRREHNKNVVNENEDVVHTSVCASLYDKLQLYSIEKFIFGFINYSPDTPSTRKIIKEASQTFGTESFKKFIIDLQAMITSVEKFLKNDIEAIREFFEGPICKTVVYMLRNLSTLSPDLQPEGILATFKSLDESLCDHVSGFLSLSGLNKTKDWTDVLNNTSNLLKNIIPYFGCFKLGRFVGFRDSEALIEASQEMIQNNTFLAAIVFDNILNGTDKIPPLVKYRIRMDPVIVGSTKRIFKEPNDFNLVFWPEGFSYIQDMIDHAIIRLHTNTTQELGIFTQRFPTGCYTFNMFIFTIASSLSLFMVISWVYTVAMIIKGIVYEKERRLTEFMKIMGLGNGIHWLAWFINSFVMMLITIILFVIILKVGKIFEYSDPTVVFVYMLGFTVSTISQCFLISVFFSRANLAAVCGGFIYFVLYLPYILLVQFEDVITTRGRMLASLSSNIAMSYGCRYFSQYEQQHIGAQWYNIGESLMFDDTFNLRACIGMMFLDSAIYLILTWYIEAVFPGQYGIPRKWYFFVQKAYWCGSNLRNPGERVDADTSLEDLINHNENFEKEPSDCAMGVSIKKMHKIYNKGEKVAVDDLSINFFEGQITSFLGHNGAGKTTTMSILTGLFPPTSGTAYIYGKDILTSMDEIRHGLGMCPQYNALFDLLTVEEHLWFYACLKGKPSEEVTKEMEQMIKDVGLPKKKKEKAKNLSGGMKRKLSVAIAFMGGSRTVMLDEPTSGVDPYSRRAIWKLLLKFRKGRTIILSTHHMDEADVLGDRIAIISQGKLCTVGTSLFLKNKFGSGYYLTLVCQDTDRSSNLNSDSPSPSSQPHFSIDMEHSFTDKDEGCDHKNNSDSNSVDGAVPIPSLKPRKIMIGFCISQLTSFIQKFVPGAVLVEDNCMELCYRLPQNEGYATMFQDLFTALEISHKNLGIAGYGLSKTSLEEVFMKVAENSPGDEGCVPIETLDQAAKVDFTGFGEAHMSCRKMIRQMLAMFLKRFHHVRRSKKGFICEILLPAGFVCLAMILSLLKPQFSEEPPLELQPWIYEPINGDDFLHTFYSNDNPSNKLASSLEHNLLQEPFYGTRCMNKSVYEIPGKSCLPKKEMMWIPGSKPVDRPPECSCETGFLRCPEGAGGLTPPKIKLPTNDWLSNTTGRDISDWLLKTDSYYQKRRFGGYSFSENTMSRLNSTQISQFIDQLIRAANNNRSIFTEAIPLLKNLKDGLKFALTPLNLKVWFNSEGLASAESYMNALNNLILRTLLPNSSEAQNYAIITINHPMTETKSKILIDTINDRDVNVIMAICVIFALSFVPASFVLFLVEERASNSKHLQFVSGINPTVYWLANWAWDMINYAIPALLCILIFVAFGINAYVSSSNLPCLFALLFLYGWAVTPMMYLFSHLFSVPSYALVTLSCVNLFLGIVSFLATYILEIVSHDDSYLKNINNILKQVFLLLPQYCLGRGFMDMASYQTQADWEAITGKTLHYDLFEWTIIGRNLFAMFLLGIFFNLLSCLIEYKFFLSWSFTSCLLKRAANKLITEDVDVEQERQRVLSGAAKSDVLRLEGLTKVYWRPGKKSNMKAVNDIYVGVPKGQCFGLLGVNGAGKTTMFKMLTGDVGITLGDAFINSYSIHKEMGTARSFIGYCPQFDALDPLLTGREHLEFYARIRGISSKDVKHVVDWAIKTIGLDLYSDQISNSYSGGNKRKLSTAIALIGNPPIIFLDEPTSGMDPGARRYLWNCINKIVKSGRTVVLTSHSMEECEALCNRLAIMVNGTFQCVGSVQHLKNRFGNGYILRVSGHDPDLSSVMKFISSTFPTARLREKHLNMLEYQIANDSMVLTKIFEAMEQAKRDFNVEDYSVSQTNLDQVFINFAKLQTDLLDEELEHDLPETESDMNKNSDGDNLSAIV